MNGRLFTNLFSRYVLILIALKIQGDHSTLLNPISFNDSNSKVVRAKSSKTAQSLCEAIRAYH